MTQKLDKFYGYKVRVANDIELSRYEGTKSALKDALLTIQNSDKESYRIYVTRLEFVLCREEHFGVKPLSSRLLKTDIRIDFNKKEREYDDMFFLNEKIAKENWLLDTDSEVTPTKHSISADLTGRHRNGNTSFEMFIITCINPKIIRSRREINIKATAHPTVAYSAKLKNKSEFTTGIHYPLDSRFQLAIHF